MHVRKRDEDSEECERPESIPDATVPKSHCQEIWLESGVDLANDTEAEARAGHLTLKETRRKQVKWQPIASTVADSSRRSWYSRVRVHLAFILSQSAATAIGCRPSLLS